MTTNPTPTSCTVRPTGALVARANGFHTAATAAWFAVGTPAGAFATGTAGHAGHIGAKGYTAYATAKAIATTTHRRPGEDVPHE